MEKVSLPIKTKIAAWWMLLLGGALGWLTHMAFWISFGDYNYLESFISGLALFSCLMLILGGIFILLKRKWGWFLGAGSLLILFLSFILFFMYPYIFFPGEIIKDVGSISDFLLIFLFRCILPLTIIGFFLILPLILLFLDRKNFWEIAS